MRPLLWLPPAAALVLIASSLAAAQPERPEIRPGHESLDPTPIRAGLDSLVVFVITGDDARGIGSYHIDTVLEGGVITRTERMLGLEGELLWGEEVALLDGSLGTLSVRALAGADEQLVADGDAVVRRWREGGEQRERRQTFDAPAFHTGTLDLVLRSLPLAEGYAATIVVLDPASMEQWPVPIHVERAVIVTDVHGAHHTTWEVHVDLDGAVDVYHFDQATRDLIRYESAADRMVMLRW